MTPLNIAVITVSDTRSEDNDTSGNYLSQALQSTGHRLHSKAIVKDDRYQIRAVVSSLIADPECHAIVLSGGTGLTNRDGTPEAVEALLDKPIPGFGELFRQLSFDDIGASTMLSRCLAGLANRSIIFCLPGSTGACRLAWEKILEPLLDSRTKPCNFTGLIERL